MDSKLMKVSLSGPIIMNIPIDEEEHKPLHEVVILERDNLMVVDCKGTPRQVMEAVCENLCVRAHKALSREVSAYRENSRVKSKVADELQDALSGVLLSE